MSAESSGGPSEDAAGGGTSAGEAWEALRARLEDVGGGGSAEDLGARHARDSGGRCLELCPICRGAEILRAYGPPDAGSQLAELQREALLTLRALIDHYVERLDQQPPADDRVEEIPID